MTLTEAERRKLEDRINERLKDGENWDDVSADTILALLGSAKREARYRRALEEIKAFDSETNCDHTISKCQCIVDICDEALKESE